MTATPFTPGPEGARSAPLPGSGTAGAARTGRGPEGARSAPLPGPDTDLRSGGRGGLRPRSAAHSIRHVFALVAILLAARVGAADEGRPGRIVFSDGRVVTGQVSFTARTLLHLVDPVTGRGRDLDPSTVAALLVRVDKESLERPYTFTKPGVDEKTYGEGRYPVRELICTAVLRNGDRLDGHLRSTVAYVDPGEGKPAERVVLRRQWKGTVGQTLDDLVYAREVRMDGGTSAAGEPARGTIEARVRGGGAVVSAAAYGLSSRLVFAGAAVPGEEGLALFESLPPDTYDLVVRVARGVVAGSARPATSARPIVDEEDLPALLEIASKGDDLYDDRSLLAVGGDRDGARLLVVKRVRRRTTNDAAFGRREPLFALDVWVAHRLEREWRIDARANAVRIVLGEGEEPPEVTTAATFAGVTVAAGTRTGREATWTPSSATTPSEGGTR